MKKKGFIVSLILIFLLLIGTSYAWFNYRGETSNQRMISGDIYLRLTDGADAISINNIYISCCIRGNIFFVFFRSLHDMAFSASAFIIILN